MPNEIEAQSSFYNLQHEKRTVKAYTLTEDEIDSIGVLELLGTISLSIFTTFAGSSITFLLTLLTLERDTEPNPYAWGILVALGAACVFPGVDYLCGP